MFLIAVHICFFSHYDVQKNNQALLKKLGIRRFHLYGQSYGGILAFEYLKSVAVSKKNDDVKCLSAILSSAPTNVVEIEKEFVRLMQELKHSSEGQNMSEPELNELFQKTHQCRLPEMPKCLADAYASAGTVWRGTEAIEDYVATPPPEEADSMPSALILRGEFDFVSEESVEGWREAYKTRFLRYKTLEGCSHHCLAEYGDKYGEIVDSYFGEHD